MHFLVASEPRLYSLWNLIVYFVICLGVVCFIFRTSLFLEVLCTSMFEMFAHSQLHLLMSQLGRYQECSKLGGAL